MAWNLEIHHLDVGQGDATLIVAREVAPYLIPGNPIVRSVLIDGGRNHNAPDVHGYIVRPVPNGAGLAHVDVMVATHYDADHYGGLTVLLRDYAGTFDRTLIFDQGWPANNPPVVFFRAINGHGNLGPAPAFAAGQPPRARVTKRVLSDGVLHGGLPNVLHPNTAAVPAGPGAIDRPGEWLVGKEVMWTDADGNPDPTLLGAMGPPALPVPAPVGRVPWPPVAGLPAPGTPGGPPALTCIAANQFVLQPGGLVRELAGGQALNSGRHKNHKSLAFLLQLDRFRYYVGGDIETPQEDNVLPGGGAADLGAQGIMGYLTAQGGVQAMKVSHHGAAESTSNAFITALAPRVAVVSCGTNNGYGANPPHAPGHPSQRVLAGLQGSPNLQLCYLTEDRHNDEFCARIAGGPAAIPGGGGRYGAGVVTAGAWGPPPAPAFPGGPAGWGPAPPAPSPCGGAWPDDGGPPGGFEGHVQITVLDVHSQMPRAPFRVSYQSPFGGGHGVGLHSVHP